MLSTEVCAFAFTSTLLAVTLPPMICAEMPSTPLPVAATTLVPDARPALSSVPPEGTFGSSVCACEFRTLIWSEVAPDPISTTPTVPAMPSEPPKLAIAVIGLTSRVLNADTVTSPVVVTVAPAISALVLLLRMTRFTAAPMPALPPPARPPTTGISVSVSVADTLTAPLVLTVALRSSASTSLVMMRPENCAAIPIEPPKEPTIA